ncbi:MULTISPECIES: type IV toxin-antitoxin system AbiEi family antitoxin domain-containing protein [Mesorhizobium]|uniref:type IV toxin-antitoxin system AbiEi family antitoxin domain-containing protein n=1 Tax=Mesorhizobium TaxID=68287 RepID=UPI001459FFD6|nr:MULTISPECIES: type IV toxin-antitoxin system AbiEi family antitoxin domain-containing protein [Mesorhizobium]
MSLPTAGFSLPIRWDVALDVALNDFRQQCGRKGFLAKCFEKIWLPGPNETANYELPIPLETTPEPSVEIRKRDRERAERVRLAGGPKPSLRERAVAFAREKGEVRTRDLTEIGVPRCYLARMCGEGLLIKVCYGTYRATDREPA